MSRLVLRLLATVALFGETALAAGLPGNVAALHDRTSGCSLGSGDTRGRIGPIRLDEEHSLLILPCEDFAYNAVLALYLVQGDTVRPLDLPSAELMAASEHTNQVYSPSWDAKTQTLDSFYKGGNGNCGAEGKWHWVAGRFELIEIRRRDVCDRTDDEWPLVAP